MNELHLFAGAGGGILGGILLGHTPVCAVEIEPYCRKVLLQRQRDGILPKFPIWNDVTTFDGTPWRGKVDVVCGGFPCQDISIAGGGAGIEGERSGLWSEMARIIGEIRPKFAFMENSPMLALRGLGRVLGDLSQLGYDARWGVLGANHIGARHKRERLWIVGNSFGKDVEESEVVEPFQADEQFGRVASYESRNVWASGWKADEPNMVGTPHDFSTWVDRSRSIGNSQVPGVAALAFRILGGGK
jgi:DNA (cytosine-5)-methyltransferase 1